MSQTEIKAITELVKSAKSMGEIYFILKKITVKTRN